jgi:NADH:ubiquinone oxidoreductase subunit C
MDQDGVRRLLEQRLPGARFTCSAAAGRRTCVALDPGDVKDAVRALRDEPTMRFMTIAAVDRGTDIDLFYGLSLGGGVITLRARIPKETSRTDTIADIVPAAELIEKEISEMFGIEFSGHPRLKNVLLPDDWPASKRPLRKPHEGNVIPQARITAENLVSTGSSIGVARSSMMRREKAGLPKIPSLVAADEERLKAFKEFVRSTGFGERAGFDWAKGKLRYK